MDQRRGQQRDREHRERRRQHAQRAPPPGPEDHERGGDGARQVARTEEGRADRRVDRPGVLAGGAGGDEVEEGAVGHRQDEQQDDAGTRDGLQAAALDGEGRLRAWSCHAPFQPPDGRTMGRSLNPPAPRSRRPPRGRRRRAWRRAGEMALDGLLRQEQLGGDLAVGAPERDELGDLALAPAERRRARRPAAARRWRAGPGGRAGAARAPPRREGDPRRRRPARPRRCVSSVDRAARASPARGQRRARERPAARRGDTGAPTASRQLGGAARASSRGLPGVAVRRARAARGRAGRPSSASGRSRPRSVASPRSSHASAAARVPARELRPCEHGVAATPRRPGSICAKLGRADGLQPARGSGRARRPRARSRRRARACHA